ncbi:competence type IV pilus minor pilin ComGG [Mesobacillus jeotgali]|uniref:competence type IV pilus minor pilin ComGG n=1 Tax=Mesobacillus jeotgali TaxID=129985 RepID=UPI0021484BEF|nr:competence type IV pilus minor pilin ComGG [Mesobacillus jeotgali]
MTLFLLILTEQYIAEKRFTKETETIRRQEYYLLCSGKEAELLLREGILPANGIMNYKFGKVWFQTQSLTSNIDEVTFNLELDSGEKIIGFGQYDKKKGLMIKWKEKN